eukprot:g17546.t1
MKKSEKRIHRSLRWISGLQQFFFSTQFFGEFPQFVMDRPAIETTIPREVQREPTAVPPDYPLSGRTRTWDGWGCPFMSFRRADECTMTTPETHLRDGAIAFDGGRLFSWLCCFGSDTGEAVEDFPEPYVCQDKRQAMFHNQLMRSALDTCVMPERERDDMGQAQRCWKCLTSFWLFQSKIHCHVCGHVFCHACNSNFVQNARCCDSCLDVLYTQFASYKNKLETDEICAAVRALTVSSFPINPKDQDSIELTSPLLRSVQNKVEREKGIQGETTDGEGGVEAMAWDAVEPAATARAEAETAAAEGGNGPAKTEAAAAAARTITQRGGVADVAAESVASESEGEEEEYEEGGGEGGSSKLEQRLVEEDEELWRDNTEPRARSASVCGDYKQGRTKRNRWAMSATSCCRQSGDLGLRRSRSQLHANVPDSESRLVMRELLALAPASEEHKAPCPVLDSGKADCPIECELHIALFSHSPTTAAAAKNRRLPLPCSQTGPLHPSQRPCSSTVQTMEPVAISSSSCSPSPSPSPSSSCPHTCFTAHSAAAHNLPTACRRAHNVSPIATTDHETTSLVGQIIDTTDGEITAAGVTQEELPTQPGDKLTRNRDLPETTVPTTHDGASKVVIKKKGKVRAPVNLSKGLGGKGLAANDAYSPIYSPSISPRSADRQPRLRRSIMPTLPIRASSFSFMDSTASSILKHKPKVVRCNSAPLPSTPVNPIKGGRGPKAGATLKAREMKKKDAYP